VEVAAVAHAAAQAELELCAAADREAASEQRAAAAVTAAAAAEAGLVDLAAILEAQQPPAQQTPPSTPPHALRAQEHTPPAEPHATQQAALLATLSATPQGLLQSGAPSPLAGASAQSEVVTPSVSEAPESSIREELARAWGLLQVPPGPSAPLEISPLALPLPPSPDSQPAADCTVRASPGYTPAIVSLPSTVAAASVAPSPLVLTSPLVMMFSRSSEHAGPTPEALVTAAAATRTPEQTPAQSPPQPPPPAASQGHASLSRLPALASSPAVASPATAAASLMASPAVSSPLASLVGVSPLGTPEAQARRVRDSAALCSRIRKALAAPLPSLAAPPPPLAAMPSPPDATSPSAAEVQPSSTTLPSSPAPSSVELATETSSAQPAAPPAFPVAGPSPAAGSEPVEGPCSPPCTPQRLTGVMLSAASPADLMPCASQPSLGSAASSPAAAPRAATSPAALAAALGFRSAGPNAGSGGAFSAAQHPVWTLPLPAAPSTPAAIQEARNALAALWGGPEAASLAERAGLLGRLTQV